MKILILPTLLLAGCFDKLAEDCDPDVELCGGQEGAPDGSAPDDTPDDTEDEDPGEDPGFGVPDEPGLEAEEGGLRSGQGTGGIPGANTWCWVIEPIGTSISLIEVDLETAAWTEIGRYETGTKLSGFLAKGLARVGDTVIFEGHGWMRIDLAAGILSSDGEGGYGSVASDGSQLFVSRGDSSHADYYASYEDLVAGAPSATIETRLWASRYAIADGMIYGAWHSTDHIDVHDGTTGEQVRTITLEGYDTWVWGVSMAGGALHLIDDDRRDEDIGQGRRIARFDPETGALLGHVFLSDIDWPSGLWCEEYP